MSVPGAADRTPGHWVGCGWFWVWAAVGVIAAVALEFVWLAPLVVLFAWLVSRVSAADGSVWGALTGIGVPFVALGAAQPAADALGFALFGLALVAGGVAGQSIAWRRRRG